MKRTLLAGLLLLGVVGTGPALGADLPPEHLARLEQALKLLEARRNAEAADLLHDLVADAPTMPEAWYFLGRALLVEGRAPEAVGPLEKALELSPGLDDARRRLAEAQYEVGNYGEASRNLNAFLAKTPGDAEAFLLLSLIEEAAGHPEAALTAVKKAGALAPGLDGVASQELRLLGRLGLDSDLIEAAARADKAGKLDPAFLGEVLAGRLEAGKPGEALKLARGLLRKLPGHRGLLQELFDFFAKAEAWEDAVAVGEGLCRNQPTAACLTALGAVKQRAGDFSRARRDFEQAASLDPSDPEPGYQAAVSAGMAGDSEAEERLLRANLKGHPAHPATLDALSLILEKQGKRGEARRLLEGLLKVEPTNGPARRSLARMLELEGDLDGAEREYRQVLKQSRGDTQTTKMLALLLQNRGKDGEAEALLDGLGQSSDGQVQAARGLAALKRGELNEALRSFEAALVVNPKLGEAWVGKADALERLGDPAAALAAMGEARKRGAKGGPLDLPEARLCNSLKQYEQALKLLGPGVQGDLAQVEYQRGTALFGLGRKEEGLGAFAKALEAAPQNRELKLELALAYSVAGRCEQALPLYRGLLEGGAAGEAEAKAASSYLRCLSVLGRPEEGRAELAGLETRFAGASEVQCEIARARFLVEDYVGAAAGLEKHGSACILGSRLELMQAVTLDASGKREAAMAKVDGVLKREPQNNEAQRLRALFASGLEAPAVEGQKSGPVVSEAAIAYDREALRLLGEGKTATTAGKHAKALELFVKAWEKDKRLLDALRGAVNAASELGDKPRMLTYLTLLVNEKPGDLQALRLCATTALALKDKARATECLDGVLQADPKDARAGLAAARLRMEAGDHGRALLLFKKVLEASPEETKAMLGAALESEIIGDNASAEVFYRRAIKANAEPLAWYNLSVLLTSLDREAEAATLLDDCLQRHPSYPNCHYAVGILAINHGDEAAARARITVLQKLGSPLAAELEAALSGK